MGKRVDGISGSGHVPSGGQPPKASRDLKNIAHKTEVTAQRLVLTRFSRTDAEFTKGAPNARAAKREGKVAQGHMFRGRTH